MKSESEIKQKIVARRIRSRTTLYPRMDFIMKKMNRTLELFIMGTCLSVYLFVVIMAPVAYYVYAYNTNHNLLFLIVLPPLYFYILAEFCESMNYIIITCEKGE